MLTKKKLYSDGNLSFLVPALENSGTILKVYIYIFIQMSDIITETGGPNLSLQSTKKQSSISRPRFH